MTDSSNPTPKPADASDAPKKQAAGQRRVNIDIPKDVKPVYANLAFISNTPGEIVIDFAQLLPRSNRGSMQARVIMSPMHAKMLQMALTHNIQNYEQKFGKIKIPQHGSALANNFFRFPQEGNEDKK